MISSADRSSTSLDTVQLPDGGSVQVSHFKQFTHADNPNHSVDNTSQDCVGVSRVDAEGNVVSASGACFGSDAEGDAMSWWWRREEAGTESCPNRCGSWGFIDGDGKYKGISGTGTWVVTTTFADGGSGTWEDSYSIF